MRYVFSLLHQFIADNLFVTLEALGSQPMTATPSAEVSARLERH